MADEPEVKDEASPDPPIDQLVIKTPEENMEEVVPAEIVLDQPTEKKVPAEKISPPNEPSITPKEEKPPESKVETSQPEQPIEANIDTQVQQKMDQKVNELLAKANQIRKDRRVENLSKVLDLVKTQSEINVQDVRNLLRVSKSTATEYLSTLVKQNKLKPAKKARATTYKP